MSTKNSYTNVNPFEIDKSDVNDGWDDWDDEEEGLENVESGFLTSPRRADGYQVASTGGPPEANSSPSIARLVLSLVILVGVMIWIIQNIDSKRSRSNSIKHPSQHENHTESTPKTKESWQLILLGERHSGLHWLNDTIQKCFPTNLTVTTTLYRPGTFFQDDPHTTAPKIIIPIFVNVYDWIIALMDTPIYAPDHANLDWHQFTNRTWSTTPSHDLGITKCQFNFHPNQVEPCLVQNDGAAYEYKDNGAPFDNILELRAAKISNFVNETATYQGVKKVIPVQYESLVEADDTGTPGVIHILRQIKAVTGQDWKCHVLNSDTAVPYFAPAFGNHDTMDKDFIQWLNQHVEWTTENLVGYKPWNEEVPPSMTNWNESTDDYNTNKNGDDDHTQDNAQDDTPSAPPAKNNESIPNVAPVDSKTPTTVAPAPVVPPLTPVPVSLAPSDSAIGATSAPAPVVPPLTPVPASLVPSASTVAATPAPADRKSTRLNSSHPSISRMPSSA